MELIVNFLIIGLSGKIAGDDTKVPHWENLECEVEILSTVLLLLYTQYTEEPLRRATNTSSLTRSTAGTRRGRSARCTAAGWSTSAGSGSRTASYASWTPWAGPPSTGQTVATINFIRNRQ